MQQRQLVENIQFQWVDSFSEIKLPEEKNSNSKAEVFPVNIDFSVLRSGAGGKKKD